MNYIKRNIIYWASEYLMSDPFKSINQNNHMNCFGESIENLLLDTVNPAHDPKNIGSKAEGNIKDVNMIISTIVSEYKGEREIKIDVLHDLERIIRQWRFKFIDDNMVNLDQDHIDAVLVDFLNAIGVRMWIDYAIYTKDLNDDSRLEYLDNYEKTRTI